MEKLPSSKLTPCLILNVLTLQEFSLIFTVWEMTEASFVRLKIQKAYLEILGPLFSPLFSACFRKDGFLFCFFSTTEA